MKHKRYSESVTLTVTQKLTHSWYTKIDSKNAIQKVVHKRYSKSDPQKLLQKRPRNVNQYKVMSIEDKNVRKLLHVSFLTEK